MSENALEIHVLNHKVRLLQAEAGFRTSLDSVFVAAACKAEEGDRVLDLGAGVGGAGFCLLWRVAGVHVTGIEIQQSHAELAVKNIALNEMQGRAEFITADIRDWRTEARFDHVICNPPYLDAGTYTPSPLEQRAKALGHTPSPPRGEGRGEGKVRSKEIELARKLRKNTTEAEQKLWYELRDRRFFNLKFKRQHPVSPYIVDFSCLEKRLIIELDGGQHTEQEEYDRKRTEFLEAQGFRVVRFWNNDVLSNMEGVLERLAEVVRSPSPNPLPGGERALSVQDWVDAGFHNLKPGGSFTIIHRADYTDKIVQALGRKFGAIEIIPLYPKAGKEAVRVIVRALKDRRTPAKISPAIVLHEESGTYTKAADAILRDGAAIG